MSTFPILWILIPLVDIVTDSDNLNLATNNQPIFITIF